MIELDPEKPPEPVSNSPAIAGRWRHLCAALNGLQTEDALKLIMAVRSLRQSLSMRRSKTENIEEELEKAYERALLNGLQENNAAMVRAYQDFRAQREAGRIMSRIKVDIVPYRIADVSLPRIVMQASDEVVQQIEYALARRKATGGAIIEEEPIEVLSDSSSSTLITQQEGNQTRSQLPQNVTTLRQMILEQAKDE